jgi:uncharacterized membrane protein
MKTLFGHLRELALGGIFFLLPVYVVFLIVTKAWVSISSVGTRIAGMFGMKTILGVGGSTILSGVLLIVVWIICGLLARFSFAAAMNRAMEKTLSKYIPGYDTYRTMAEEKLHNKSKILPYTSALIKQQEYWQPAFIVEQDGDGNYVVFLPDTPETGKGHVLLAKQEQVRLLPEVTANQLAAALGKMGKGLVGEHGILIPR